MKKKNILPSQVEVMCRQEYQLIVEAFGGEGSWDDLSRREQLLISTVTNDVVQRVLRNGSIPAPLPRTQEEGIAHLAELTTFFRSLR